MARTPTRSTPRKPAAAQETSESIAEQTRQFLDSGNRIEVIDTGVSGLPPRGAKAQISTSRQRKA